MFGTGKQFLSLNEGKRNGGNCYSVLTPTRCGPEPPRTRTARTQGSRRAAGQWRAPSCGRPGGQKCIPLPGGMGCGGPGASAWNLGNRGNGSTGDNKHGMEFQRLQQGLGMGKLGKVLFFTQGWEEAQGRSCSDPSKAPYPVSQWSHREPDLPEPLFSLYSFQVFIAHCIPSRIPWGLKPLLGYLGA